MASVDLLVFLGILLFLAGYAVRHFREVEIETPGPVETYLDERRQELREDYADGRITHEQFASEIETVENPSTERVMHLATDVDGIGPHIAFKVARKYDDLEALADADVEELAAINGVGENRAHGLVQRTASEKE